MDPDDASPATATSTTTPRTGVVSRPSETRQRTHRDGTGTAFAGDVTLSTDVVSLHLEFLTLLVAVVGAGLIFEGFVATFAGVFCLAVAAYVLGRLAIAEWRRLELSTTE